MPLGRALASAPWSGVAPVWLSTDTVRWRLCRCKLGSETWNSRAVDLVPSRLSETSIESRFGCLQIEQRDDMDSYPRQDLAFVNIAYSCNWAFAQ